MVYLRREYGHVYDSIEVMDGYSCGRNYFILMLLSDNRRVVYTLPTHVAVNGAGSHPLSSISELNEKTNLFSFNALFS